MSILKSIATSLYRFVTTEAERQANAVAELSDESRATLARTYFAKEVPLLDRGTLTYSKALTVAEDIVITHHNASSFVQMCRSVVRRNSSANYFQMVALGNLIRPQLEAVEGTPIGGEAGELLQSIDSQIKAAAAERNPIKRRSILRNAINERVKGLDSNQLSFAVELVISIAGEFRAQ